MVGPCHCRSAHPEAKKDADKQLIRGVIGFIFLLCNKAILTKLWCIHCFCVSLHASRSESVFLPQGCPAPWRATPQKSEVWPYPSCSWTDWIKIQNINCEFFNFLNLFPVVSKGGFSYITLAFPITFTSTPVTFLPFFFFQIFVSYCRTSLPHIKTSCNILRLWIKPTCCFHFRLSCFFSVTVKLSYLRFVTARGFSLKVLL